MNELTREQVEAVEPIGHPARDAEVIASLRDTALTALDHTERLTALLRRARDSMNDTAAGWAWRQAQVLNALAAVLDERRDHD